MIADSILSSDSPILVTGASGFIGSKVLETLLESGFIRLRCFVRPSSRRSRLDQVLARFPDRKVEVISGDLLAADDCQRAADRVEVIYHLAAGMDKSFAGAFMNSALTTRNLMNAFLAVGHPKRFVNVSSFAVYSNLNMKRGSVLDENAPLEDSPQERADAYSFGKLRQEELVKEYGAKRNLPFVILRPGAVFGPGNRSLTGRSAIDTFGFFLHLGGANQLPLTYVDNCAEAIVLAGMKPGIDGEIFNVVDDQLPSSAEFFRAYKLKVGNPFSISVPYAIAHAFSSIWEKYSKWSGGQLPPAFNRRRSAAEWKGNRFSNRKLHEKLGWRPKVPMPEAMKLFLAQFETS